MLDSLTFIKTLDDVRAAVAVTDYLVSHNYKTDKELDPTKFSAPEQNIYVQLKQVLSQTKDFDLNSLKEELNNLDKVTVTLAFEASPEFISKIYDHVKALVEKPFVLDIRVDASIIGGAILDYAGLHKDVSVEKKLNAVDFPAVVRNILK